MSRRSTNLPRATQPARTELELRHLRVFVALVEHGSMSAASRALGCAQSTVSEALAALERALGTFVVQRQSGVQGGLLTSAGHSLLPHARQLLAAVDNARAAVAEAATSARGVVEIVARESISTYLLPEVLARLRADWPNVRFAVSVASGGGVREGGNDASFDVALAFDFDAAGPRLRSGVALARFADHHTIVSGVPLVIFAAPSHPLAAATAHAPPGMAVLAGLPLLISDDTWELPSIVKRFVGEDDLPGLRLQPSGSVEAVKRGVIADARAVGILPSYAIAEDLQSGRVARLQLRCALPPLRLVAVLPRSRARHPSLDALLEAIRRAISTDRLSCLAAPRQRQRAAG